MVADMCSNTPLHIAAKKGHIKPLEEILDLIYKDNFKFSLDAENLSRKTAMLLAAENGHTE